MAHAPLEIWFDPEDENPFDIHHFPKTSKCPEFLRVKVGGASLFFDNYHQVLNFAKGLLDVVSTMISSELAENPKEVD